jgi:hypothetical protein
MQIAAAKRQTARILKKMQTTVGVDMTRSIVLSSVTREARRQYGLEGARSLVQGLIDTMADGDAADVCVPSTAFQLGPRERAVWMSAGIMIRALQTQFDMATACKLVFESLHATKPMLQGLISTMAEVAQYDRD